MIAPMDFGGYYILFNGGSGSKLNEEALSTIKNRFSKATVPVEIAVIRSGADFLSASRPLVDLAESKKGVVVAAGGDGTISTVAGLCRSRNLRLGIIPLGTFNYFARNLDIPVEINESIDVIFSGHTRRIPVGKVGQALFINNASIGFYKDLIEARERHKSRFGRLRIVALFSALSMFLRRHRSFSIELEKGGEQRLFRTTMLFVGNNAYQLKNLGLPIAGCIEKGKLGVLLLKEMSALQTVAFLARAILGGLEQEPRIEFFCSDSFGLSTFRRVIDVVVDGEIIRCSSPLPFSFDLQGVTVLAPPPAALS